ncbi:unnamed protein product [Prunus brigantina]
MLMHCQQIALFLKLTLASKGLRAVSYRCLRPHSLFSLLGSGPTSSAKEELAYRRHIRPPGRPRHMLRGIKTKKSLELKLKGEILVDPKISAVEILFCVNYR